MLPQAVREQGEVGTYPAVALLAWATVTGGVGRPASIIGGLACLGVLLLMPVARGLGSHPPAVWTVAVHVSVVAVCSRVAGLRSDPVEAAVISGFALTVGFALLVAARWRSGSRVPVAEAP